ncbi:class I SAM-dependent methyltransferase [Streptomyces sp. OfavH-34-F]|uniref:class I SAM-dependent methyltransferase n=1 Tax=Streptomyces sp. OfavH-34-F TaxID=2917760 RepID=UPI001EF337E3|nr:class I SAM-dependent methyltransferase [Streptomyces sp. OfavH-34-F]MCG7523308.1 class I SAM-dependent methyltransferase [Streptomyces sp. OfavH-34-F]
MTEPTYLHATRVAYDTVAVDYAKLVPPAFENDLYGRAMISTFAELTLALDAGPVADLGCGPGHLTAHLQSLGVTAFGIDLSPQTVAVARRRHPDLRFDEGSMTDLDLADGSLGGIIAWYSIVHTPPELLPAVFAEFHRVLAPGGHLLIAFKAGDRLRHLKQAYGHELSLDVYWTSPDRIAELLSRTGLVVDAQLIREPNEQEKPRQGQQAYLVARKPASAGNQETRTADNLSRDEPTDLIPGDNPR